MSTLRRYLEQALRDAGRVELRQMTAGKIRSGIYDNLIAVEDAVVAMADTSTVYMTLNAPRLCIASNTMNDRALTDDDIGHIVRLPFDFDPERPKGSNASDGEVAAAVARRDRFVAMMKVHGFPMPLLGMSGNGAHAVYRCRLPASTMLREVLATVYTTLKGDFSDDVVRFDSTVRNASRIWRIYGTVNRKSPATASRPQRTAECRIPARWECVSPQALVRFANLCAKRNTRPETPKGPTTSTGVTGDGDYSTLDAVAWFQAHDAYKRRLPDGKHAVVCPWRTEHSDPQAGLQPTGTDTVLFDPDRASSWPSFHCSRDHCDGRSIVDVIAVWRDADRYCTRQFQRRST